MFIGEQWLFCDRQQPGPPLINSVFLCVCGTSQSLKMVGQVPIISLQNKDLVGLHSTNKV